MENEEVEEDNKESEEEEIKEEKDLVEHAAEAVEHLSSEKDKRSEHISSETTKELDESKEIENMKKVEAALFISGRFLTLQELVMLTDINPLMLKEILEKLIEKYNDNSGIEIIVKGDMWKMDVCKEHVHMINKLATGNSEFSKAEQETLAVIAYKQPVKQSVIIKIRGNKAYDHVKKFIENGLIIGKRVGHTKELKLSDDFHEYFHLRNPEKISDDHRNSENNEEFRDIRDKNVEKNGNEEGNENEEPIISEEKSEEENSLSDEEDNSGEKEVIEENKQDENTTNNQ